MTSSRPPHSSKGDVHLEAPTPAGQQHQGLAPLEGAEHIPFEGEIFFENAEYLALDKALTLPKEIESKPPTELLARLQGKRVLVMGSGSGSNFEALVHRLRPYGIEFSGLFCDQPKAKIIERAKRLGIPVEGPSQRVKRKALNDGVLAFLEQNSFDVLALAGYMRILPPRVVTPFYGKIINIHPSILPDFPGLHGIEQAFDAGVSYTGITVHLVNAEVDDGPILAQARLPRLQGETLEELETRVHALEHLLYPQTILRFLSQHVRSSTR